jgi:hypothetical protein
LLKESKRSNLISKKRLLQRYAIFFSSDNEDIEYFSLQIDARNDYRPPSASKKIYSEKLEYKEKAAPKIDARSEHVPKGGDVKIYSQKLDFKVKLIVAEKRDECI